MKTLSITGVPALVLAIFSIIALLAGAFAVFKASYAKTQLELLNSSNAALQARVTFLEHEDIRKAAEAATKYADMEKALETEKGARLTLEAVVTGKKQLEEVSAMLGAQNRATTRIEHKIDTILTKVGV